MWPEFRRYPNLLGGSWQMVGLGSGISPQGRETSRRQQWDSLHLRTKSRRVTCLLAFPARLRELATTDQR